METGKTHEHPLNGKWKKFCHYFNNSKHCPFEELGIMFKHEISMQAISCFVGKPFLLRTIFFFRTYDVTYTHLSARFYGLLQTKKTPPLKFCFRDIYAQTASKLLSVPHIIMGVLWGE